jgi:hypothetical protein
MLVNAHILGSTPEAVKKEWGACERSGAVGVCVTAGDLARGRQ